MKADRNYEGVKRCSMAYPLVLFLLLYIFALDYKFQLKVDHLNIGIVFVETYRSRTGCYIRYDYPR